jgi:hypothetical protein
MSRINLGDRVRFVNETIEGVVTSISGDMAGVTNDDDFEIPVPLSQIVRVQSTSKTEEPAETISKATPSGEPGIFIAFEKRGDTLLDLNLFNNRAQILSFHFLEITVTETLLKKSGGLRMGASASLGCYDLAQFSRWPAFCFQVLIADEHQPSAQPPLNRIFRFASKEFHASFRQVPFLRQQAYFFRLDESTAFIPDLQKLKERDFTRAAEVGQVDTGKPPAVVDLHAEKISADAGSLTASAIVQLQMDTFTSALDRAMQNRMEKIVFIHGVGNHFLKNRIRNYLALQKDWVARYADADNLKYGGGATEVFLK